MTFEQALDLIQALVPVVALLLIYRSYPAGKIDNLLNKLAEPVEKSPTKLDDILLQIAGIVHGARRDTEPGNLAETSE